jgi:hypothetical protein
MADALKAERYRQDLHAALERLRNAIRTRVPPRDQAHFLEVTDRIQEAAARKLGDLEQLQASLRRSKDTTRRLLRTRPVDMVQLLNEIDGLEQEVVQFFTAILQPGGGPPAP